MTPQYVPFTGEFGKRPLSLPRLALDYHWPLFISYQYSGEYSGVWVASESTLGLTDGKMLLEIDRGLLPGHLDFVDGPARYNLKSIMAIHRDGQEFAPLTAALTHWADGRCAICEGFGTLGLVSASGTLVDPAHDGDGILAFRFVGGRGVVRPIKIMEAGA